jgi:hypothetical protein
MFRFAATVTCRECQRRVSGLIMLGEKNQIVDTAGFMVFAAGPLCDACSEKSSPAPN